MSIYYSVWLCVSLYFILDFSINIVFNKILKQLTRFSTKKIKSKMLKRQEIFLFAYLILILVRLLHLLVNCISFANPARFVLVFLDYPLSKRRHWYCTDCTVQWLSVYRVHIAAPQDSPWENSSTILRRASRSLSTLVLVLSYT